MNFDIICVGGGLANCLIALRLAQVRPDIAVCIVEAGEDIAGNHLWSSFDEDVTTKQRRWTADLTAYRWEEYSVRFPKRRRTMKAGYRTVTSARLAQTVKAAVPSSRTSR